VNHRTERHIWYTSFNFDMLGVSFAGATAFWRAAYATDVEAMELLVAAGADPSISTRKEPQRRFRRPGQEEDEDKSGLPEVPLGGPAVYPIHAASGVGYGEGFAANSHSHAPDSWVDAVRYLVEEHGADVNARDLNGYSAVHHAAARGDNELIEYLVSQGADVMVVSRRGETTVDMANGPRQRVQPFPETIALLEGLGAINNHNCQSC
jgi:ankyrin repeat protein